MADRRDGRRNRATTWGASIAAPLLVVAGLTLASWDAGSEDSPARRAPAADVSVAGAPSLVVSSSAPAPASPDPELAGLPKLVVVPALRVEAAVSPIELEDGALTPPADPQRVGWWSEGARPGASVGSAVLTGHTVHTGGGAFDDLETLVPGDDVVVRTARGPLTYDVVSVRVLGRGELARDSAQIFEQHGPSRLVLITCEDWDGTAYLSNVVVIATPTG